MAQLAGDVGQPRAEQEHVHAVAVVGHRVQEMQQDLRVARPSIRRCRRARPAAAAASPGGCARWSGSRRPGAGSGGWCGADRSPARADRRAGDACGAGRAAAPGGGFPASPASISSALIASKSMRCSRSWSDTVSTASITGGSSSARGWVSRRLGHRLGDAAAAGRRAFRLLFLLRLEQRHGDGLLGGGGIAPEQVERLVEHVLMLVAMDHRGAQRGARLGRGCRGRPATAPAARPASPPARPAGRHGAAGGAKCMTLAARVEDAAVIRHAPIAAAAPASGRVGQVPATRPVSPSGRSCSCQGIPQLTRGARRPPLRRAAPRSGCVRD